METPPTLTNVVTAALDTICHKANEMGPGGTTKLDKVTTGASAAVSASHTFPEAGPGL